MKRLILLSLAGMICATLITGCGSSRSHKRSPAELAALEEAALRGEDIPLDWIPMGDFVTPESKGVYGIFNNAHFDYDKSNVREADYPILNRIGSWLKDNHNVSLLIEGHCDERGSNEYNMALGEQRALSVRRYLVGLGIDPSRLYTVSYGEEKPLDPGHNESAWTKNRRAQFLLSK